MLYLRISNSDPHPILVYVANAQDLSWRASSTTWIAKKYGLYFGNYNIGALMTNDFFNKKEYY